MKFLILSFLISAPVLAQDTGGFSIARNGFKDLFNQFRVAQPKNVPWAGNFFPYSSDGTAIRLDARGNTSARGRSPMEVYGTLSRTGSAAHDWEMEFHSCDKLTGSLKRSCESWWGHCNGWAAAAIKETEPRKALRLGSETLSVAEQKAIYSELWLSSSSLNAGWTDKEKKTGAWIHDHDRPTDSYRKFWDVSPRAFFLIFTNYVGAQQTGIVIDRFTGDEVWNQPVVGYRILPLRPSDITEVRDGNRSYWSVFLRIKIYWANDLGTHPAHLSDEFDITKTTDYDSLESFGVDYEGRFLQFRLNFDAPVRISADGTRVLAAGNMLGDGIWEHQEDSRNYPLHRHNEMHPDFIWLPLDPIQDFSGYGNPHVDPRVVAQISAGQPAQDGASTAIDLKLVFAPRAFGGAPLDPEVVKKAVAQVIRRDGIRHAIYLRDISISRSRVSVIVKFPHGVNAQALSELFRAAGMDVRIE